MVAKAGATFGSEMHSWLATLILKELDQVVKWCVKYYDVQLDSHSIVTEVIYTQPNSLRSSHSYRVTERQKHISKLEEELAGSSTKSTDRELKKQLLAELQAKHAKEAERSSSITAVKGARLLVEKWKVSKKTIILSGHQTSLGASGEIELLTLIWNYYKETRSEFQNLEMDIRLQATLDTAVKRGHSEFVKKLLELTNEEELVGLGGGKIVYLNTSGCLLEAAKQSGTLSTIQFLLENTNSQITKQVFDAIVENGDPPTVEWAIINYARQFASETTIEAAVNARNSACWKVGQWWAHYDYDGGGEGFSESQLVGLSRAVFGRQQMLEHLESIVGNNIRGAPPRSKEKVSGTSGDGCGGGDWIRDGFKQAYDCLKKPIPEDYLVAASGSSATANCSVY